MKTFIPLLSLAIAFNSVLSADPSMAAIPESSASLNQAIHSPVASFYPLNQALGRQDPGTQSTASQLVAALFGLVATGRVAPLLTPVLIKFLVLPLVSVVRSLAKTMLFFGVTSYLLSGLVPVFLAYTGMLGSSSFVGRAQQSSAWFLEPINDFLHYRMGAITDGALNYMDMNSAECRLMLSCKVGQFMMEEYPGFTGYLKKFGITSYVGLSASNNTATMLDAMVGRDNCTQAKYQCPNLRTIEEYLSTATEVTRIVELTSTTAAPPTTTSPKSTTESVLGSRDASNMFRILQELSQNYYDNGRWRNITSLLS